MDHLASHPINGIAPDAVNRVNGLRRQYGRWRMEDSVRAFPDYGPRDGFCSSDWASGS